MLSPQIREAIKDYRYLLDRAYPQRSGIKLVGDKYQLSGTERSMLYRGISNSDTAAYRKKKVSVTPEPDPLHVDSHNVLFTLANYLQGRKVYISDDGLLRDAGEIHGRLSNKKILEKALSLLEDFIIEYRDLRFNLLLDQPVSNSGKLASGLNLFMKENDIRGNAHTENSPDFHLITEQQGIICSSDSVVVDKTTLPVFDLSRYILEKHFDPDFDDLGETVI